MKGAAHTKTPHPKRKSQVVYETVNRMLRGLSSWGTKGENAMGHRGSPELREQESDYIDPATMQGAYTKGVHEYRRRKRTSGFTRGKLD